MSFFLFLEYIYHRRRKKLQSFYDRLGNMLRDRLDSDEDPFISWEAHTGKTRQAGNSRERTPPPHIGESRKRIAVPTELIEDFQILGLLPGEPPDLCKAAWKNLLKAHHPDTREQNPEEQERSTVITKRINNSYRKISHWYKTGSVN